ncbi:MAG: hypothetical protein IPN09_16825 [Bacteroidetes bacterium]|nr:hypothetical protein [Bacteroidota bacterium]
MNKLTKTLKQLDFLPEGIRMKTISFILGNTVKYVGTSVDFEKITPNELIVSLPNKSKVRNHIGQIPAAHYPFGRNCYRNNCRCKYS